MWATPSHCAHGTWFGLHLLGAFYTLPSWVRQTHRAGALPAFLLVPTTWPPTTLFTVEGLQVHCHTTSLQTISTCTMGAFPTSSTTYLPAYMGLGITAPGAFPHNPTQPHYPTPRHCRARAPATYITPTPMPRTPAAPCGPHRDVALHVDGQAAAAVRGTGMGPRLPPRGIVPSLYAIHCLLPLFSCY